MLLLDFEEYQTRFSIIQYDGVERNNRESILSKNDIRFHYMYFDIVWIFVQLIWSK